MIIPTEPIGSIPRPPELIEAVAAGDGEDPRLDPLYDAATRDTTERFEATGSPVITDGEQRKYHNFWTYRVQGLPNTAPDGFQIPFSAGHTRRMPRLTAGPFRYRLNDIALSRFTADEQRRIGVHTCPGGDRDSPHSGDVDCAEPLPSLFERKVGNFCIALAGEADRIRVLRIIGRHLKADQRAFVGVVVPIDPRVESPEEVRDRILEAARHIPVEQLGTTDDCGFSPFCDDTTTTRDTALAKIRARVLGTALASERLGGR